MTWAKLDDKYPRHPRVVGLSDGAFRLHTTALCHCGEYETDGKLARHVVPSLTSHRTKTKLVAELQDNGLWLRTDDGWQIRDYLQWNPSRAELEAARAAKRSAGQAGGRRSGEARAQAAATARAQADGEAPASRLLPPPANPVPSRPVPSDPSNQPARSGPETPPAEPPRAGGRTAMEARKQRWIERERPSGQPPLPRHDPLGERFRWEEWFVPQPWLDWAREQHLEDREFDKAVIQAKDKIGQGWHDVDWWDVTVLSFVEQAISKRAKPPGLVEHGAVQLTEAELAAARARIRQAGGSGGADAEPR